MTGGVLGALAGLLVGLSLSYSVYRADARKRASGARATMEYKSSLVIVPVLLALVGGLVGAAIAH